MSTKVQKKEKLIYSRVKVCKFLACSHYTPTLCHTNNNNKQISDKPKQCPSRQNYMQLHFTKYAAHTIIMK